MNNTQYYTVKSGFFTVLRIYTMGSKSLMSTVIESSWLSRSSESFLLTKSYFLLDACPAERTVGKIFFAVPAATDVSTREEDDVALKQKKIKNNGWIKNIF